MLITRLQLVNRLHHSQKVYKSERNHIMQTMSCITFGLLFFVTFALCSCQTPSLRKDGLVQLEKSPVATSPDRAAVITSSNPHSLAPTPSKTSEVEDLSKSLKSEMASPTKTEDKLNLASLLVLQGQLNEAETICRELLTADAKNIEALKISTSIFIGRKNFAGALYTLHQIEEINTDAYQKDSDIQNILGVIALHGESQPDFVEAMIRFEKGLSINPNNVAIRLNIGTLYFKNRFLDEAIGQFTHVLKLIPEQKDARLHLAMIYSAQTKHEIAKDMYKDLLSDYDENPILLYNVASSQRNSKAYENAMDTIETYLSSETPKDKMTAERFIKLFEDLEKVQLGRGEKVDSDIKELVALTLKNINNEQKPAIAKTKSAEPTNQSKEQALEASLSAPNPPKAKASPPAAAPATVPQPAKKKPAATFDDDDIDSLERALDAH